MRRWALAGAVVAACGPPSNATKPDPAAAASPEALAAYLDEVAAYPPAARAEAERGWKLPPAAWNRIVVPPFRDAYARYEAHHPAAIAALDAGLHAGRFTARQHYAGDARATAGELWLRWAVPTLYPSRVVELDGKPLDAVFLYDDGGWRTLAGLDRAIADASDALDPACTGYLRAVTQSAACAEVGVLLAEAAIRSDRTAFARACSLAAGRCGIRSAPP